MDGRYMGVVTMIIRDDELHCKISFDVKFSVYDCYAENADSTSHVDYSEVSSSAPSSRIVTSRLAVGAADV